MVCAHCQVNACFDCGRDPELNEYIEDFFNAALNRSRPCLKGRRVIFRMMIVVVEGICVGWNDQGHQNYEATEHCFDA